MSLVGYHNPMPIFTKFSGDLIEERLQAIELGIANQTQAFEKRLTALLESQQAQIAMQRQEIEVLRRLLSLNAPGLLIAEKTYDTSHPNYDAVLVRNFPGRVINSELPCKNSAFHDIVQRAIAGELASEGWRETLKAAMDEVAASPHSNEIFERQKFVEEYLTELNKKYGGDYRPGWVNLDDALLLYWLVRKLNPNTIVQTGVCNGLSAAFMTLALYQNGIGGKLHAIDLPPRFSSSDANWQVRNQLYGVVIPEGKCSGWLVPDACREHFLLSEGDAKALLPKLVDELDGIDMFYHDSDHSYNHMLFEFRAVAKKLTPGAVIVADDISWNASLWDFADEQNVPAYNFNGSLGIAFF